MGLETATYIHELDSANPVGGADPKSQGDDHIRLVKDTLQNTFPSIEGAITLSHTQINAAAIKSAANDFTARQRVTADNAQPATGKGLELFSDGTYGAVLAYDRDASLYLRLDLQGLTINLGINGTTTTNNLWGASVLVNGAFNLTQLAAGAYTPAVAAGANCSAPSASTHFHQRVGNIVTVGGRISMNVTSGGGVLTSVAVALPIASNFSSGAHAVGNGVGSTSNPAAAFVGADTINDRLIVEFYSTTSGVQDIIYTAQYQII